MKARSTAAVLDLLYGAVTDGDLWPSFLERFTDEFDGNSAWLSHVDMINRGGAGIVSRMDPVAQTNYFDHFISVDPLSRPMSSVAEPVLPYPMIFNDEYLISKGDLLRTEFYNDFMKQIDVHSVLMIRLGEAAGAIRTLNINRSQSREQFSDKVFETARYYHPHLMHAVMLNQKLVHSEIDRLIGGAKPQRAQGICLLDRRGRINYAQPAAESLLSNGAGLFISRSRLCATDHATAERLQQLIRTAIDPAPGGLAGGTVTIPMPAKRLPLLVQIGPVRNRMQPFYADAAVVVILTDLGADRSLPEQALRTTFGLTVSEARIAIAIANGQTPKEIARRSGLHFDTVRSHLQRVYTKTDTNRQVDLTLLLIRMADHANLPL